jgi:hypothetical protein
MRIGASLESRCEILLDHKRFAALLQRTTMEDLFAPTTRLRDLYHAARERYDEDDDGDEDEDEDGDDVFIFYGDTDRQMSSLVELELAVTGSSEDTFLHCGFTWNDFYSWARGKMVWLSSPDIFSDLCLGLFFLRGFIRSIDHFYKSLLCRMRKIRVKN